MIRKNIEYELSSLTVKEELMRKGIEVSLESLKELDTRELVSPNLRGD